jgi:hypothetical protein
MICPSVKNYFVRVFVAQFLIDLESMLQYLLEQYFSCSWLKSIGACHKIFQ